MLRMMKDKKKVTVKELQSLCGFLNFINKAIFPGCTFTQRMYSKFRSQMDLPFGNRYNGAASHKTLNKPKKLKQHHHIRLDTEFKDDCQVWISFLEIDEKQILNRPMVDLVVPPEERAVEVEFYSDASANEKFGFGCILKNRWIKGSWEPGFVKRCNLSIEYLELYALCVRVMTWQSQLCNIHMIVHCDNQAVIHMINGLVSKCRNCMKLIRILALDGLIYNRKITACYVMSKDNFLSDALSRD